MKNVILTVIVILTVAACDNAGYSTYDAKTCGMDQWDAGYDVATEDAQAEIDALAKQLQTAIAERDAAIAENTRLNALYEYPVEDWQARAETCELKLLEYKAANEICESSYTGLLSRAEDLEDIILTLDFDTRAFNCDNENWEQWICDSYLHN